MKLRLSTTYLLYILLLHAALVYLIFRWLRENELLFIASEVLVLLSLYVALRIYRNFQRPAEFVSAGIEQIKDKDFTVKFVPTGNREVDELIRVYNLMIDQLRQERTRQQEQQQFLEKLVEAAPTAILIFDFDERIASVNPRAAALLGLPATALVGKTLDAEAHPLLKQLVGLPEGEARTLKGEGVQTYRVHKSHLMDRGFRRSFLIVEELTAEILETEKKSYGKVIRMMAHEVNNSIGAVNSILDVSQRFLDQPGQEDIYQAVQVAMERNDRLNRFMRRFAEVVRLPQPQPRPVDLTALARDTTRLMRPLADAAGVDLRYEGAEEPLVRPADREQLEQVLVNLIKNAIEACEPGQSVIVSLQADRLSVRDNGKPIAPELEGQLFNPFHSTKPDGQGIGLTLTREILMNHGFHFSLKTRPDGWTEFLIGW